jgi:hypothetical protein
MIFLTFIIISRNRKEVKQFLNIREAAAQHRKVTAAEECGIDLSRLHGGVRLNPLKVAAAQDWFESAVSTDL